MSQARLITTWEKWHYEKAEMNYFSPSCLLTNESGRSCFKPLILKIIDCTLKRHFRKVTALDNVVRLIESRPMH